MSTKQAELTTRDDAYALLHRLGASPHLLLHLQLVGEAADGLIALYAELGVPCNAHAIELGAALHDAGKIVHANELTGPGHQHEHAGEQLLLAQGVPARLARCCVTHAAWNTPEVSFEELTVALADALWKGVRIEALELRVIDTVAERLGVGHWTIYTPMDDAFERIASRGPERLERSRIAARARDMPR